MAKILVVDDVADNRKLLQYDLEDDGFEVVVAEDGLQALEVVREEEPDVVLLDIMMPRLDGIETLKRLKADDSTAHIPVVLLSAKDQQDDLVNGLDAGAHDYITKPIRYPIVAARLRSALRVKEYEDKMRILNDNLIKANEDAEQALRARSTFLATMSHEIRTPITTIIGLSEILSTRKGVTELDRTQVAQTILSNSHYLLEVVNNILDLSKLESGGVELDIHDVSLFEVIRDVEAVVELKALERELTLSFRFDYPIPASIKTDPIRLKQVLVSLLNSCIKHTQRGSIRVSIHLETEEDRIYFNVIDTGSNIQQEALAAFLTTLSGNHESGVKPENNDGMDVHVTRRVLASLNGSISVHPESNGVRFAVSIPATRQEKVAMLVSNPLLERKVSQIQGPYFEGKVLLVEDDPINQKLITHMLTKIGLTVDTSTEGLDAVDMAKANNYDIIFMDMHLPTIDGMEATRTLKRDGVVSPVVALTATQDQRRIEEFFRAGCIEFLPKPFTRHQLYSIVKPFLSMASEEQRAENERGKDKNFSRIVLEYCNKLEGRIQTMELALSNKDWDSLCEDAHRLVGAGLLGFPELAFVAALLEEKAYQKNAEAVQELMQRLKKEALSAIASSR